MKETENQFLERAYVDWDREKVLVFSVKRGIGNPDIWTLQQFRQYREYLRKNGI